MNIRVKGISSLMIFFITIFASGVVFATDSEETIDEDAPGIINVPDGVLDWEPPGTVFYDNGTLVNGDGTGAGGADESILQNGSLGMSLLGFGHQVAFSNRVADDFEVPAGGWAIAGFVFFAYQTNSPATSTMTAVNYRIWDGPPGAGGTVIYGDTTTNQMVSTEWSGVYRVSETTTGSATNRPIMAQVTSANTGGQLNLSAGTYWVDWQTDGSLGSGPWAPPVTITGTCITGDAFQSLDSGTSFNPAIDTASTCRQDFPFLVLGATGPARFAVNKDFDDDNPLEVDVEIQCDTGLPLSQPATISEDDGVTFVVTDFEPGAMNCVITETAPAGYTASYDNGSETNDTGCEFEAVTEGFLGVCNITNTLDEVDVEVTKVWIDENPQFDAVNIASAYWFCENTAFCEVGNEGGCNQDSGNLDFYGNPGTDSFSVFPSWDGGTECEIYEINLPDGGVEVDDSDCQSIVVSPGSGGECTIFNTRLYEGIPTLSHYGLAIMALIMLGVGLVGFRRFV